LGVQDAAKKTRSDPFHAPPAHQHTSLLTT
jgi:hypothetical protein